ncbi:hypothetical protein DPMN_048686 [Dreissena polymorpha]|uniref:Uncharacterized protein n=1 Tax=Dreissena polymorpha TaxID=45954 RepID=A0A9D4I471_DREPO|nr:hypothetical protein DPMN_048686 [Dreissena polymorpha]
MENSSFILHHKTCECRTKPLPIKRAHRSQSHPVTGKVRYVVVKFAFFMDREDVRGQWPELKGSPYNVFEQFPPEIQEIQEKRRRLVPKMKEAKSDGKKAWIAYDTLYIDGRPVSQ